MSFILDCIGWHLLVSNSLVLSRWHSGKAHAYMRRQKQCCSHHKNSGTARTLNFTPISYFQPALWSITFPLEKYWTNLGREGGRNFKSRAVPLETENSRSVSKVTEIRSLENWEQEQSKPTPKSCQEGQVSSQWFLNQQAVCLQVALLDSWIFLLTCFLPNRSENIVYTLGF